MDPFEAYVRGYLDAIDTFENFRDMPIEAVIARAREFIAQRNPEIVQRVAADHANVP